MKKILVVLLSLTLIFAFTGCTSSNNGAAEDIEIKTQEVVTSNASENHEQFYALKKQVDAVDDELDKLDDEFEYAYQMKEISFETYKARERTIEKLEDELELAEEALENKYGIDD